MLTISLPQAHQTDLVTLMCEHPSVGAVRYNTGMAFVRDPYDALQRVKTIADAHGKPLYVDLKGKQLRIAEWSDIPYGPIRLNHNIEVDLPASVHFRGDDVCKIVEIARGNEIFVDPLPKYSVGSGQSINILGDNLVIKEGLLPRDHEYIKAALQLGLRRFMLSFIESIDDVREFEDAVAMHSGGTVSAADCEIIFKIESETGVTFVRDELEDKHFTPESPYRLMAARDDLFIQIGLLNMPTALQAIADRDPQAICASRLLMGLETESGATGEVSMADFSDLMYMQQLGFQHFMLSDGLSQRHAAAALRFWSEYEAVTG